MSEEWAKARLVAAAMLALYIGVMVALSAREMRFLAGVEPRRRRLFATQDVLVQLAIIGVLLPCAIAPQLSKSLLIVVVSAFTLLWLSALWAVISRSMYSYRLMLEAREERKELAELLRGKAEERDA